MKKRYLVAFLAVLVCGGLVWGGGTQEAGKAEKPVIRFACSWGGVAGNESYFQKLDEFAAQHPEFELKVEVEAGDNLRTKIKTDMAAGNLPDVFNYWIRGAIKAMVDNDLLLEVNEYFGKSPSVKRSAYTEMSLSAYSLDGGKTSYGFPLYNATNFFMVNKPIFAKYGLAYPKNYDDLKRVGKVFNDNGLIPVAVGAKLGNPGHFWYGTIYHQYKQDSQRYAEGWVTGANRFDCAETRKAAELVLEQAKLGLFPKDTFANGDFGPAVALYKERRAAMILSFAWMITQFTPDIVAESELIPFPMMPGAVNDTSKWIMSGVSQGYVMNKKAFNASPARQRAMIALMDHLLSDTMMTQVARMGRTIDKVDAKLDTSVVPPLTLKVQEYAKGKEVKENLWAMMPDPSAQEVYSLTIDELWAQSVTADQFVTKVQNAVTKATK